LLINNVEVEVVWENFIVGSSFFVPCSDTKRGMRDIEAELEFKAFDFCPMIRVEDGVLGIRVWRVR
jgi:hypothetical protein